MKQTNICRLCGDIIKLLKGLIVFGKIYISYMTIKNFTDIFAEADQSLFRRILNNESHALHQLLPEKTNCTYNLRFRQHNRQLTRKSAHINDSLFFIRMLYKDAY